jgi:hypothetical protein
MSSQTAPLVASPAAAHPWARRWLRPSPAELLFLAVALWLIAFTAAGLDGVGLLRDSQTGYHVRIGEYVLAHRSVPSRDFLSFTRPGEPWFAWEWLAGAGSAVLYHWDGMRAIIVVSALILGFTVLLMVRQLAWRGANVFIAIFLAHLAIGASSMHYLARPHIFTLLFLAGAVWILDRDRRQPTAALWTLVPLTALWVNLHGGFFGLLVSTGILAGGSFIEWLIDRGRRPEALRYAVRYALLTAACLVASLANPYGILEHLHLVQFMRETWYLKLTEEYQPPRFLTPAGAYYGVLLAAGLLAAARLLWRKQIAPALLILAWAYASSRSMRHIPIYAIVVLPWLGDVLTDGWRRWTAGKSAKSLAGILEGIAADFQPSLGRSSLFVPIAAALLLFFSFGIDYPRDFPEAVYPVALVTRHAGEIAQARVFTTDSWGHYLTFRYPPPFQIFIDGRCDFFGERFTNEYLNALNGVPGWDDTLRRYRVQMVLVPPEAGLAVRLQTQPGWRVVDNTDSAVLFALNTRI